MSFVLGPQRVFTQSKVKQTWVIDVSSALCTLLAAAELWALSRGFIWIFLHGSGNAVALQGLKPGICK